ncbi:MAG: DUF3990 domain-containing protein [Oscillospiraceae bacterium]|nr:DUF3990 domain-containing protein [Oscillospiraceae bacterium]
MKLFHGSYLSVEKPEISFSRNNVDFGKGFYTTPIWEQGASWANRFKRKYGQSVVSSYEIDMDAFPEPVTILTFEENSEEWLEFIIACRRGEYVGDYDIIIGGVANDRVFDTIQLYFDGLIDKSESIKRLKYDKPNLQYCFRSQSIIDGYLKFIKSEVL